MAPSLFLHNNREPGCWGVVGDRKYYFLKNLFVKRTLRKHEWTVLQSRLSLSGKGRAMRSNGRTTIQRVAASC